MFSRKVLVASLCFIGLLFGALILTTEKESNVFTKFVSITDNRNVGYVEDDVKVIEVSYSENEETDTVNNSTKEVQDSNDDDNKEEVVEEEVVEELEIVYDGMTLDELAGKLDRSLKNELAGKGYLYASYSLEKGVDPYLAVAISLEETGCNWNCSSLVKSCNNVGGMKGSGCGSYGYFNTLDEGIMVFIDNISRNYVAYGLTTAEAMNSKYAENPAWSTNVNNYIYRIKSN